MRKKMNMKWSRVLQATTLILSFLCVQNVSAQTKSENKKMVAEAVQKALNSKAFTIHVEQMHPQSVRSRVLNSYYSLELRNDTVFSDLPYFGEAYSAVLGGGKGLVFDAPISDLEITPEKKGKTRVRFTTKNEEDVYTYTLIFWENGSATINVQPMRRQFISYIGHLEL